MILIIENDFLLLGYWIGYFVSQKFWDCIDLKNVYASNLECTYEEQRVFWSSIFKSEGILVI